MATVDIGTGTTLTFASFTAELTAINWDGITRDIIETSHLSTAVAGAGKIGSKTFIPGDLVDPGEISIEGHFDPDLTPPMESAAGTATITFPLPAGGLTKADWEASAIMSSFSLGVPLEDKMTFSATIKVTGEITLTAST